MRLMAEFSRDERARYVSHLDMQRAFMRLIRRAGIDAQYSEGYNPHILLSFAAPMPVGLVSRSEYFEIKTRSSVNLSDAVTALNACAPAGIAIKWAGALDDGAPKLMAAVSYARYLISLGDGEKEASAARYVAGATELITGKGPQNRRDMVLSFEAGPGGIDAYLSFGGAGTLNPRDLMEALDARLDTGRAEWVRTGLYTTIKGDVMELRALSANQAG